VRKKGESSESEEEENSDGDSMSGEEEPDDDVSHHVTTVATTRSSTRGEATSEEEGKEEAGDDVHRPTGNCIVDVGILISTIEACGGFPCPRRSECNGQCCLFKGHRFAGTVIKVEWECDECDEIYVWEASKTFGSGMRGPRSYDLNYKVMIAFRNIGGGNGHATNVLTALDMNPITDKLSRKINERLNHTSKMATLEVLKENLKVEIDAMKDAGEYRMDPETGIQYVRVNLDGAWNTIGYTSNSGQIALYGQFTGLPLKVAYSSKFCSVCSYHQSRGRMVPTHTCLRTHEGSSGSMEPSGFLECAYKLHTEDKCNISHLCLDGDTKIQSCIELSLPEEMGGGPNSKIIINRDVNHQSKNLGKQLLKIPKLSKTVVKKLQQQWSANLYRHRGEGPVKLREALLNVVEHYFNNHERCGEFFQCPAIQRDTTAAGGVATTDHGTTEQGRHYIPSLPYGAYLKDVKFLVDAKEKIIEGGKTLTVFRKVPKQLKTEILRVFEQYSSLKVCESFCNDAAGKATASTQNLESGWSLFTRFHNNKKLFFRSSAEGRLHESMLHKSRGYTDSIQIQKKAIGIDTTSSIGEAARGKKDKRLKYSNNLKKTKSSTHKRSLAQLRKRQNLASNIAREGDKGHGGLEADDIAKAKSLEKDKRRKSRDTSKEPATGIPNASSNPSSKSAKGVQKRKTWKCSKCLEVTNSHNARNCPNEPHAPAKVTQLPRPSTHLPLKSVVIILDIETSGQSWYETRTCQLAALAYRLNEDGSRTELGHFDTLILCEQAITR
jgi:hypothetical protein